MSKDAEVAGLGLALADQSVKGCMRSCAQSRALACRSFQYDPVRRSCRLSDEGSRSAQKADGRDLYEPVCLALDVDLPCTGDFVYEKVQHMNLVAEDVISVLTGQSAGRAPTRLQRCRWRSACRPAWARGAVCR